MKPWVQISGHQSGLFSPLYVLFKARNVGGGRWAVMALARSGN